MTNFCCPLAEEPPWDDDCRWMAPEPDGLLTTELISGVCGRAGVVAAVVTIETLFTDTLLLLVQVGAVGGAVRALITPWWMVGPRKP